jgi:hypothetical protein
MWMREAVDLLAMVWPEDYPGGGRGVDSSIAEDANRNGIQPTYLQVRRVAPSKTRPFVDHLATAFCYCHLNDPPRVSIGKQF